MWVRLCEYKRASGREGRDDLEEPPSAVFARYTHGARSADDALRLDHAYEAGEVRCDFVRGPKLCNSGIRLLPFHKHLPGAVGLLLEKRELWQDGKQVEVFCRV